MMMSLRIGRTGRHCHLGEWSRLRMRNFREQCCDCGLIHRLDFRIVDGRIEFRTRRDDRATAAARRSFKFTSDE